MTARKVLLAGAGGGPLRPARGGHALDPAAGLHRPRGIALRYGLLYGGGAQQVRALLARRRLPVARGGVLGWVHHQDAAAATVAALEHGRPGQAHNKETACRFPERSGAGTRSA